MHLGYVKIVNWVRHQEILGNSLPFNLMEISLYLGWSGVLLGGSFLD
jgi:hypothetical protein